VAIILAYAICSLALRGLLGTRREKGCVLADVLAYNLVALVYAVYCAAVGVNAWFGGEAFAIGGTLQERLYGYATTSANLAFFTAAYEAFNTIAVILIPEYRTAAYVCHHFTTFILALLAFHPFLHYYTIFFFGVATVSSVPLCFGELCKFVGARRLFNASQLTFAISFLTIRSIYWPIVSLDFWSDTLAVLSESTGAPRAHSLFDYYFLLLSNIGLTSLQFLWTTKILFALAARCGLRKSSKHAHKSPKSQR